LWFSFGAVNQTDFWNNSAVITANQKSQYGQIRVNKNKVKATIITDKKVNINYLAYWISQQGDTLLIETSDYNLTVFKGAFTIDKITKLNEYKQKITFYDNKEGLFGIRLTSELEMPTTEEFLVNTQKIGETIKTTSKIRKTSGFYTTSEGKNGYEAWGTEAEYMINNVMIDTNQVGVMLWDYNYNTFNRWPCFHARDYGLFSINNFGKESYLLQKEENYPQYKWHPPFILKHSITIADFHLDAKNKKWLIKFTL